MRRRTQTRKISGFNQPSRANEEAFALAIQEVASASAKLLDRLVTARSRPPSAALAPPSATPRLKRAACCVRAVLPRRSCSSPCGMR